jgi:hypothetical protein
LALAHLLQCLRNNSFKSMWYRHAKRAWHYTGFAVC